MAGERCHLINYIPWGLPDLEKSRLSLNFVTVCVDIERKTDLYHLKSCKLQIQCATGVFTDKNTTVLFTDGKNTGFNVAVSSHKGLGGAVQLCWLFLHPASWVGPGTSGARLHWGAHLSGGGMGWQCPSPPHRWAVDRVMGALHRQSC